MLSIILVNYNERDHLRRVLEKLPDEFVAWPHEILVVDNHSTDDSAAMVAEKFPNVRLDRLDQNRMYGPGNNRGMEQARGDWLLLLNPDIDWQPGQLRAFVEAAQSRPNVGVAGPKIMGSDGRLQRSAHRSFPTPWTVFVDYCLPVQQILLRLPWHPYLHSSAMHNTVGRVAHLTGVCLLVPSEIYRQTKGFDPAFTMYLEETEWQRRIADLGKDRWYLGSFTLTHYGSTEKRFAQVSRNFLWGLWYFATKHWKNFGSVRLLLTLWLAAILSLLVLLPFWIPSWIFGRAGRRIRHYTKQYLQLLVQLVSYPTHKPTAI